MRTESEKSESKWAEYGKEALSVIAQGILFSIGGLIVGKAAASFGTRKSREIAENTRNVLDLTSRKTG